MKNVYLWLLGVFIFAAVIAGGFAIKYYTAPIRGVVDAQEKIHKGSNRIQKYNYFFEMCARAQEVAGKLDSQYELLSMTVGEESRQRVLTNITGLKGEYKRVTTRYNADARKGYTDGQFRSSSLPYQLSTDYNKGEYVSCAN